MPTSAPDPRTPDPQKAQTDFWLRMRDADETALAAIVKEYEVEIRRAATMRLGPLLRPHLDSVDLVQSVYITLLKGLRGNPPGPREDGEHVVANRDGEPGPMAEAERRDAIERIMQECDPADKKLLQLRLEGHSTAEAARALDADPDVLRVRLSRLRKRLTERGLLAEWL